MPTQNQIRNPVEWAWEQLKHTGHAMETTAHTVEGAWEGRDAAAPVVRRIHAADIGDALARGVKDFAACRTDVVFLCLIYPVAGLLISRMATAYGMVALIFPLISGFALVGPLFGLGLYEMSRRRERGIATGWADAFAVVRAPAIGAIVVLGALLLALLCLWLFAAHLIYIATLGPEPPISATAFARDVLTTPAGWTMIAVGCGVGFVFALVAMVISVVSFPLLLDRDVGVGTAIATSIRAVRTNPGPMAMWGLIVAAALVIGAIPLLVGLAIVLPVLGHATWHLYRKVVG
ncbi:MAG: DUF2189 domain-containing protein [Alphaproteobacteria bacterium]|nr:DUF2189 domain-containing protein [Alphaproteobacteria bacterium]